MLSLRVTITGVTTSHRSYRCVNEDVMLDSEELVTVRWDQVETIVGAD